MQEILQQIRERSRESTRPSKEKLDVNGGNSPFPAFSKSKISPLDFKAFLPLENLKSVPLKCRAQRECLCDCIRNQNPVYKLHKHKHSEQECVWGIEGSEDEENDMSDGTTNGNEWGSDSIMFARHCEAKLAERICKTDENSSRVSDRPEAYNTHLACQILREICKRKLPFSRVLRHIYDELERALFCNLPNTASGLPSNGQMYFELASRLESEKTVMEEENQSWHAAVVAQQSELELIEEQMKELRSEVATAESVSKDLEEKITATVHALNSEKEKGSQRFISCMRT